MSEVESPEVAATPKSCREMFIALGKNYNPTLTSEQQATCARIGHIMTDHPFVGMMIQHAILIRYQRATGKDALAGAVDWKSVLQWLVENMPKMIELLLSLLAMFGV